MKRKKIKSNTDTGVPIQTRLDVTEVEVIDDLQQSVFAGQAEFSDLVPDESKAYVRLRLCHSLPNVIGPEMKNGLVFAFHPRALARNYISLLHQQTNIGHRLRANGTAANDAINGCIIAVSYPEGWEDAEDLPETGASAPAIDVLAVMFKKANGVKGLLGEHLSARKKWSVSIETRLQYSECGVFDTRDGSLKNVDELDEGLVRKVKGAPVLAKVKGGVLAWVLGGKEGQNDFSLNGLGYVPVPAEKKAVIVDLAASSVEGEEGSVMIAAGCEPEFFEGVAVEWDKLNVNCWGGGEVSEVVYEGEVSRHGIVFCASEEEPVLIVEMANGVEVARPASSVRKAS